MPVVINDAGHVVTTSRDVAHMFDQRHAEVKKHIRRILRSMPDDQFKHEHFKPKVYRDDQGRYQLEYELTLVGTLFLIAPKAMGADNMAVKIAYVRMFEQATDKNNF